MKIKPTGIKQLRYTRIIKRIEKIRTNTKSTKAKEIQEKVR